MYNYTFNFSISILIIALLTASLWLSAGGLDTPGITSNASGTKLYFRVLHRFFILFSIKLCANLVSRMAANYLLCPADCDYFIIGEFYARAFSNCDVKHRAYIKNDLCTEGKLLTYSSINSHGS